MRKIHIAVAALLVCTASMAQNINPTVEVTNTYQGDPSDVLKPVHKMNVPDSLLRFDMDFDYEVFEKPYQGAYKFKPYQLNMRPDKDAYRGRSIYLKTGAGYSFHPQLDFVFSPEQRGPFQMSVYATHKSYFGKYRTFAPTWEEDHYRYDATLDTYKGYDALTTAGFEGRYNFEEAIASFRVGYYGLMTKDTLSKRMYNGFDFNTRFRSNNSEASYFHYDVSLDGRIGNDRVEFPTYTFSIPFVSGQDKDDIREGWFRLRGEFGPQLNYYHRILLGLDAETCSYGGSLFDGNAGKIAVIPKYEFETGRWDLSLGLRIEKLSHSGQSDTTVFKAMHTKKGRTLYPEIRVGFTAADNLLLYANLTGGSSLNAYCQQLAYNHHFNPLFAVRSPLMDNSIEKYNIQAGAKGNLGAKLQFDINGGVAGVENGLVDDAYGMEISLPIVSYQDYSLIYANVLLGLKAGNFDLDASARFRNQQFLDEYCSAFRLPKFSGDLRAVYHFGQRVYFGTKLEIASKRERSAYMSLYYGAAAQMYAFEVPGYVDLGLLAGWQLNRRLGFWAEAGNLLCDNIQRNLFYAEKDLWITAGITLNL
ncbi:MAG: TonB-dependent receptor [Bacteroidales bacterium]|nr:TonB-dependent receptor [Bacteroidales bacterium]